MPGGRKGSPFVPGGKAQLGEQVPARRARRWVNGCDTSNDTSDDTSFDTKCSEVKGSEEKRERPRKRGTTLPDGFTVSSELIAWAKAKGLTERQISEETEKFCDHHRSKGSVFRDWDAAWRTWIRKHLEWRKERHGIVDIYTPDGGGPGKKRTAGKTPAVRFGLAHTPVSALPGSAGARSAEEVPAARQAGERPRRRLSPRGAIE